MNSRQLTLTLPASLSGRERDTFSPFTGRRDMRHLSAAVNVWIFLQAFSSSPSEVA
jgi:hypothetical protein